MEAMNNSIAVPAFLSAPISQISLKDATVAPFAISPYTLVDHAWTVFTGYHADEFRFTPGVTPMSTFNETLVALIIYYATIFGGREMMRDREPYKLNGLFMIHNFYLTAISGLLLTAFVQQLAPGVWQNGLYDGICGATGWTQPLLVLYYLNYLTKYLELVDTVFLVLKKKPLTFLHTYHHGATALLCYTQLIGNTSVSWVPITLNLTVHVVMYWYYFQSARGVRIWWKKYITLLQISQFVLDLGFIYFATWDYYISVYAPWLPHVGSCAGQPFAAFAGCAILSSYLVLFVMFYLSTYKKSPQKALKNMKNQEVPTIEETSEKAHEAVKATSEAVQTTLEKLPAEARI